MTLIAWKNSFESGHPSVDHEHKELIDTINDMYAKIISGCSKDIVNQYLGEIHALIEAHFALEETIMRSINYKDREAHKKDHDRLLEDIRDIMDTVNVNDNFDYNGTLAIKMSRWFAIHFATLDNEFHKAILPKDD